ncbi:DUF1345 domain-containing protein [Microbacterium sp. TWP3-1-2b2]|uniref:DUF1345 domain-containing protein n=1 Tax=Microbacterium sp. TWP3-1-2b2 TaxID=2804651 RepID=UPI003CED8B9B
MARYVSDTARANWSSLVSTSLGAGLVAIASLSGEISIAEPDGHFEAGVLFYLTSWPLFAAVYLIWTHAAYTRRGPRALGTTSRRERALKRRWWSLLFGYGGASSWTLTGASITILISLLIAQNPDYRQSLVHVALGLLCVASSWALMVYAFALEFLRVNTADDRAHIHLETGDDMLFGDYLTLTVLLSTMAATVSASIRSREAWLLVRTNVLFAFVFNSVIVAMVVSLLLGGLLG